MKYVRMLILSGLLLASPAARGQSLLGTGFTFQGQFKQNGTPFNGTATVALSLWDAPGSGSPPTGGNQIGATQTTSNVTISSGLYTVALNTGGEFGPAAFIGNRRWLQITVNGTTLSPRQELTAEPYALFAGTARGLALPYTAVATPAIGSPVLSLTCTGGSFGSSAIIGTATGGSAATYGLIGQTDTAAGAGVWGNALNIAGTGVIGTSQEGYAGHFSCNPSTATVLFAENKDFPSGSGTGPAVLGQVGSSAAAAIVGLNSANGESGQLAGPLGAVYGTHGNVNVPAGRFDGDVTINGSLTIGTAWYNTLNCSGDINSASQITGHGGPVGQGGINGIADQDFYTYGVYAQGIPANHDQALYAQGDFVATGNKSFLIDHPLDPANKYLYHFCAEGPEPIDQYSGTITTDQSGYATVRLPDYFEALNKDFRYSLTVIDASDDFVLAKVVREVRDNAFQIRTSKAAVKVSWEVKGTRNDAYERVYGFTAEQAKPDFQRGKYLFPELFDQPAEQGIHGGKDR